MSKKKKSQSMIRLSQFSGAPILVSYRNRDVCSPNLRISSILDGKIFLQKDRQTDRQTDTHSLTKTETRTDIVAKIVV